MFKIWKILRHLEIRVLGQFVIFTRSCAVQWGKPELSHGEELRPTTAEYGAKELQAYFFKFRLIIRSTEHNSNLQNKCFTRLPFPFEIFTLRVLNVPYTSDLNTAPDFVGCVSAPRTDLIIKMRKFNFYVLSAFVDCCIYIIEIS